MEFNLVKCLNEIEIEAKSIFKIENCHQEILYHYCSAQSFYKIITSKTIRLPNINYTNDPYETSYSNNLLKMLARKKDSKNFRFCVEDFNNRSKRQRNAYILCLSELDDSLPMWNSYGDKSRGVAIGFKAKELLEGNPELTLGKISYDLADDDGESGELDEFVDICRKIPDEYRVNKELNCILDKYLSFIKHKQSQYEEEWRLLRMVPDKKDDSIKFDFYNGKILEFCDIPLKPHYIKELFLGGHFETATPILDNFLRENEYKEKEIEILPAKCFHN